MHSIRQLLLLLIVASWSASDATAQMFSVDDNPERAARPTTSSFLLGVSPVEFTYRGREDGSFVPLGFKGLMYRAVLESPTLTIYGGYGSGLGDDDAISSSNLGAMVSNRLALSRNPKAMVYMPFRLQTDWRTVRNSRAGSGEDEFQQSSVMAGTGIGSMIRGGRRAVIDLSANVGYGYSVRSFGANGGQSLLLEGKARYHLNGVAKNLGLAIGYDYTFQDFIMSGEQFDYRLTGHSIFVGVRF